MISTDSLPDSFKSKIAARKSNSRRVLGKSLNLFTHDTFPTDVLNKAGERLKRLGALPSKSPPSTMYLVVETSPEVIEFEIQCIPPKATSQQKGACRTGRGVRFYKKKHVKKAETELLELLAPHIPRTPFLQGPIALEVTWCFPWRTSEPKKNRVSGNRYCDTSPDLSNLIKLLEDCMTKLRFWHDDGQIAKNTLIKKWGDTPGLKIRIHRLEPSFSP